MKISRFSENLALACERAAAATSVFRLNYQTKADNSVSESWTHLARIIREAATAEPANQICLERKYKPNEGHHLCVKLKGHSGSHKCGLSTGLDKPICTVRWKTIRKKTT